MPDSIPAQSVREVRAIAARARKHLTRAAEVAGDECWLLLHDEADQLKARADELHAIARRERQRYLDERADGRVDG